MKAVDRIIHNPFLRMSPFGKAEIDHYCKQYPFGCNLIIRIQVSADRRQRAEARNQITVYRKEGILSILIAVANRSHTNLEVS
jgi:hypothetical protein